MKTQEFLNLLKENPNKEIVFQFREGRVIPKAYHITEVKNVHIESVDCGGRPDSYDQTIVQLWHNGTENSDRFMTGEKADKIFSIVQSKKPLKMDAPIFFEWGDEETPTSNYDVKNVDFIGNGAGENQIILKTFVPPTVCKPAFELETVCCDGENSSEGGCC